MTRCACSFIDVSISGFLHSLGLCKSIATLCMVYVFFPSCLWILITWGISFPRLVTRNHEKSSVWWNSWRWMTMTGLKWTAAKCSINQQQGLKVLDSSNFHTAWHDWIGLIHQYVLKFWSVAGFPGWFATWPTQSWPPNFEYDDPPWN